MVTALMFRYALSMQLSTAEAVAMPWRSAQRLRAGALWRDLVGRAEDADRDRAAGDAAKEAQVVGQRRVGLAERDPEIDATRVGRDNAEPIRGALFGTVRTLDASVSFSS